MLSVAFICSLGKLNVARNKCVSGTRVLTFVRSFFRSLLIMKQASAKRAACFSHFLSLVSAQKQRARKKDRDTHTDERDKEQQQQHQVSC